MDAPPGTAAGGARCALAAGSARRHAPRIWPGHIPGAVYVSLDDDLSDHARNGRGRHPLPPGRRLQAAARRWGIRQDQPVVVYDDWNRAGSRTRLVGADRGGTDGCTHPRRRISGVDGSRGSAADRPGQCPAGDVTMHHDDLYAGRAPTLTAADRSTDGQVDTLLDARAPERFRGEVEPVDPVAGHIPGARNLPSTACSTMTARSSAMPTLHALVQTALTRLRVGVYCGSGVTASVVLAALSAAGIDAALFPGSWSQWSGEGRRDAARAIEACRLCLPEAFTGSGGSGRRR